MKAALKEMARDEKRLDGMVANYHVRKAYRQRQTGRLPGWMKPIPCLCKIKHYSQGYTSPCGRWVCSDYVRRERNYQLQNSDIMTERKKNAAYWKQMKTAAGSRVRRYANKYGVSIEDAEIQLQYYDMLAAEESAVVADAMTRYLPRKSHEEE